MTATLELHPVHVHRIRAAVEAALAGRRVVIRVECCGDIAHVTWVDRQRHVIAAGGEGGMKRLLPMVQAEFTRQLGMAKLDHSSAVAR